MTRLYRKLKPAAPLFSFATNDGTSWNDHTIRSATINRGHSGRGGGVFPSTLELEVSSSNSVRTGKHCTLVLTGSGADLVAAATGATAATIQRRFTGRIGRQSIDDRGIIRHRSTRFMAASWTAQLPRDHTIQTIPAGQSVHAIINQLMTPRRLEGRITPVRMADIPQHGTVHTAPAPGTYSDLIGKYTTDLGILVRDTRTGASQILTHKFRRDRAVAGMASAIPLTRSQVLAPARWEQSNDMIPRNFRLTYVNASNVLVGSTYGEADSTIPETVAVDMSHVKFTDTSQPTMEAYAQRAQDWQSSYAVPSVTVDLLALITSPHETHRRQAGQLLSLEAGDPVYLSGDWYSQLQGIHYAEGIREHISPDAWELELSLVPAHVAVGEISPPVPARTWESAQHAWNTDPRTWGNA